MSTPDIRVKLSPEGVKEVLAALRLVQAEAAAAQAKSGEGLGVVRKALSEIKSLLPTIGLAALVGGFIGLSKQALNTAEATGELRNQVGGTVEEISALTYAFRTSSSDQAGLQTALTKTVDVMDKVRNGSAEANRSLRNIGLDPTEIARLSPTRAFEAIAAALAKLPPGAQRAAAQFDIFGNKSGNLTKAILAVGTQGIDPLIEKADSVGVLVGEGLAKAADDANSAMGDLKLTVEGIATQFTAGFAPQIAGAMKVFGTAITGDGTGSLRKFADFAGFVVRYLVTSFVSLGKAIGANVAALVVMTTAAGEAVAAAARLDFSGAKKAFADGWAQVKEIRAQLLEDQAALTDELTTPAEGPAAPASGGGGGGTPAFNPDAKAAATAQAALLKARLENEAKIRAEQYKADDAAAQRAYEAGLTSLNEYFNARKRTLLARQADELAVAKAQRALVAGELAASQKDPDGKDSERIKLRQQLAQIDAEISARAIASTEQLAALEGDRAEQIKALTEAQRESGVTLAEAEGRRHDVFMSNLQAEIAELRKLGAQAGTAADEIESQVARLTAARTSQFNFEEVARKGKEALASFNTDAEQIRRDQQAGVITAFEGEYRLIELQKQRLEVLKALAAQGLVAARATGDEDSVRNAEAFAASIDTIGASYRAATDLSLQFRNAGVEGFNSAVKDLVRNADQIKSVGEAFEKLGDSIIGSLSDIAAEIISRQATLALLNLIPGGGLAGAAASIATGQRGGQVQGFSRGGSVRGRRLNIRGPDKIPALLQEGEFVVRRSKVREPGALAFLRRWNGGRMPLAHAADVPRFAEGGLVGSAGMAPGAAGGRAPIVIQQTIQAPTAEIGRKTASQAGLEAGRGVQNAMRRNG